MLLKEAANKPLRTLLQVDGWHLEDGGDSIMEPDQDGDWISRGMTEEFRRSDMDLVVRMHIDPRANPKIVQRLLLKMAKKLT